MPTSKKQNAKAPESGAGTKQAEQHAQALLELHLEHELEMFDQEAFMHWVASEVMEQFDALRNIPLKKFVPEKQVKAVIKRNVVENKIPGAVTEIAGEAASALFSSSLHQKTKLKDIFSQKDYEGFVNKILELPEQRKLAIDRLIELPLYRELISGVLYQAILRYIYEENIFSKKVPGISSALKFGKKMIDRTAPNLDKSVEESVRRYISDNLVFLLKESKAFLENSLTDEDIKVSALELWDSIENNSLSDFQDGMNQIDLSEFIVLGYEFWLRFRKTPYFRSAYTLIVEHIYKEYGNRPLGELLDDFNITPDQVVAEVAAFSPAVLEAIKSNGQLEALLRRRLEGFYFSPKALTYLESCS